MSFRSAIQVIVLFFIAAQFISCAGYNAKSYNQVTMNMINQYRSGQFKLAYQSANGLVQSSSPSTDQDQDYRLTLLERGKIALANGDYDNAIKDLQEAEKRLLQIEGTISLSEEAGSLFTNDLGKEYEAEAYEKIMISPYLALAYLGKNDFAGARVERNRTINKINQYIEREKKTELENPFARYISALIYEMEDKNQDAKIEYRKIAKNNRQLSSYMNQEIKKLNQRTTTDLVIITDVGLAPTKYEQKFGPVHVSVQGTVVSLAFAYAKVRPLPSSINSVELYMNNTLKGKTRLLYNLEKTVLEQHKKIEERQLNSIKKRVLLRLTAQIGLQVAGKKTKGIAGGLMQLGGALFGGISSHMERADLRRWSTLPKQIQFTRIRNLTPGEQTIQLGINGNRAKLSQARKINLVKNKINILYLVAPQ